MGLIRGGRVIWISALVVGLAACGPPTESVGRSSAADVASTAVPLTTTSNGPAPAITEATAAPVGASVGSASAAEVDVDIDELPDDWLPVPELSEADIAEHPLLSVVAELPGLTDQQRQLVAAIGVARFVLADGNGQPVGAGTAEDTQRSLTITAFHGSQQAVVYTASFAPFYDHPDYGFQLPGCSNLWVLQKTMGTSDYRLAVNAPLEIFEDRWYFGDGDGNTCEAEIIPAVLEHTFSLVVDADDSLVLTGEDGSVAQFLRAELD